MDMPSWWHRWIRLVNMGYLPWTYSAVLRNRLSGKSLPGKSLSWGVSMHCFRYSML